MPSDPSDDRSEDSLSLAQARIDLGPGDANNREREGVSHAGSRRRASKTQRAPRQRRKKDTDAQAEDRAPDDPGARLRGHAAEILEATRGHIVAQPLQAVLVAAAVGAFAALLLGSARR